MSAHAFLAPSGGGCTVNCPAAPLLQSKYPEPEDSEASREGTAAHWVLACMLQGVPSASFVGSAAPNGVMVDREMIEAAEMCAEDVHAYTGGSYALHIEEPLACPDMHPTHNWGTPDVWAVIPMPAPLIRVPVWDFKYGHALVEVFENWQLINYSSGILTQLGATGLDDQNIWFDFRIVQPRASHMDGTIRNWLVRASDLRPRYNILRHAYALAMQPEPPAKPGPWCKTSFCSAAHACEALQRAAYDVAEMMRRGRPHDLTPAQIGLELRTLADAKRVLDARVDGLKAEAEVLLRRGERVPYWAMAQGQPREIIDPDKADEFIIAGDMLGKNVRYAKTPKVITPKQAIALGMNELAVKAYTKPLTGETKLVSENTLQARRVFGT